MAKEKKVKVKLRIGRVGRTEGGGTFREVAGDVTEVGQREAGVLVARRQADYDKEVSKDARAQCEKLGKKAEEEHAKAVKKSLRRNRERLQGSRQMLKEREDERQERVQTQAELEAEEHETNVS